MSPIGSRMGRMRPKNAPGHVFGTVAQLVERVTENHEAAGSMPACPTSLLQGSAEVACLAHNQGGRGFESRPCNHFAGTQARNGMLPPEDLVHLPWGNGEPRLGEAEVNRDRAVHLCRSVLPASIFTNKPMKGRS
jgi:hypothetical protein